MKLEHKFFNAFFYPFLIGVVLSMLTVTIFLSIFTNKYLDKKTGDYTLNLEKNLAKININSVNILLTTTLLKVQASLHEQILFYLKLANKIENINLENYKLNDYLKCVLDVDDNFNATYNKKIKYIGYWFKDENTTEESLDDNSMEKKQLIIYSNILQNFYSTLAVTKSTVHSYFFIFPKTDLLVGFPLEYDLNSGFIFEYTNFPNNPVWCCNNKGEIYKIYKFKCRDYYNNIIKAKKGIFDYNYKDINRTIFITSSYRQFGFLHSDWVFNLCIEFNDPISKDISYACADVLGNDLVFSFDNFNSKLAGYYLITSIGFNKVFYFPQTEEDSKTPTENIFRWDRKFYLEEKTHFMNHIQKLITSNYNKFLNKSDENNILDEIIINGENISEQYFYFNGVKYYFSIFPVILENLNSTKEHVLSIIYLYNNQLFYDRLCSCLQNSTIKIILEIALFSVFGSGLLYIVVLTFNRLAKYIVIPIKNVNYMLKGINIGGKIDWNI